MDESFAIDEWDRAASRARTVEELAEVATRFLQFRKDEALGLAPATLLPPASAPNWILYWCAARRVDDSIEAGHTNPSVWRERVARPSAKTLADRCVGALLSSSAFDDIDLPRLLDDSLRGVALEKKFSMPRSWDEYEALLDLKSVPTMHVFDALMAPEETTTVRARHARAFAISAQLGDDCRDVFRDLERGRCFVTREELGDADLEAFARSPVFSEGRLRRCLEFLNEAARSAAGFRSREAKERARRLQGLWDGALRSGQVRPSDMHLTFSQ